MNLITGLSSEEAKQRHSQEGPNEAVPSSFKSRFEDLKKIILNPMGLMLLGLSALYALMGDSTDSLILLGAYIPVTLVDVLLEIRATKALKALRATLKPTVKVIRDSEIKEIPCRNLVRGDIVVFEEGQALPADGKIIEAETLSIDEAALTGESIPVRKEEGAPFFGGTVVLHGRGLGLVELIGKFTRFGQIAYLVAETESEISPLQKKVHWVIQRVLLGALGLAVLLFVIEMLRGKEWLPSLIIAFTFGMAAVPEEFPIVFTLYLGFGGGRLSKHGVLVKSLPSVETLGSVDVICTDKTGTLTEGKFHLETITPLQPFPKELLWQVALMACEERPIDAMETAVFEKGKDFQSSLTDWKLEWDYPFETQGKHMSHVWRRGKGQFLIAMKGAVEGVLEHCQIKTSEKKKLDELIEPLASQGKRLLGLAYREGLCTGDRLFDEKDLTFLGVLVFDDPIRPSAKHAIEACQKAGIEIKMLTGDHPITAHAVADEIGLTHSHEYLFTGAELSKLTRLDRWKAYQKGAVFSRVQPEQKYEMVEALKELGKVVAMTGDGINDAPALKLADIGISMGASATDVARSASQMILLRNDFKGLVEAVFEGRRIFENLKRSFSYLIAFHVPIILLTLLPPLFAWGDLLLPIHIVLLELIVHPVSALAFENLPTDLSRRDGKALLSKKRVAQALLSGVLLSLGSLWLFHQGSLEAGIESGRALALSSVIFGVTAFVFVESWPTKAKRLGWIGLSLVGVALGLAWTPSVSNLFHVIPLTPGQVVWALGVGVLASVPRFVMKLLRF